MKKDCTKADELIALYPEDEISDALRRHIEECPRCRSAHEEVIGLLGRLRSDEAPVPPDEFWGRLRSDVRQGIKNSERAGTNWSSDGKPRLWSPLWQRALVPAMLVIALVSAYLFYTPGNRLSEMVEAPLTQELAEAGVEINIEMDADEVTITSMIMETGELSDSLFYELYALDEEELADFYDELGLIIESMRSSG
jgi:hypothetical protein